MNYQIVCNVDNIPDFNEHVELVTNNNDNHYVIAKKEFHNTDVIVIDKCISFIPLDTTTVNNLQLYMYWAQRLMSHLKLHEKLNKLYPRTGIIDPKSLLLKLTSNTFSVPEGKKLYYITSFFNHSCNANSVIVPREDGSHEIKATRSIAVGEQITIDYLGHDMTDRKSKLKERYNFDCECGHCDHPQVNGKIFVSIKKCMSCYALEPKYHCSKCEVTHYCNISCQRSDWKRHKEFCPSLKQTLTYNINDPHIMMKV